MVSRAYERTSVIITTNLPFENWTEVLGSERLPTGCTSLRQMGKAADSSTPRPASNGNNSRASPGGAGIAHIYSLTSPPASCSLAAMEVTHFSPVLYRRFPDGRKPETMPTTKSTIFDSIKRSKVCRIFSH